MKLKKSLCIIFCLVIFCLVLLPLSSRAGEEMPSSFPWVFWLFPLLLAVIALLIALLGAVFWFGRKMQKLVRENTALCSQLQLAEQAIQQAPLPILRLGTDLTVTMANQCALHGHDRASLIGMNLLDLHPELADHPVIKALETTTTGESDPTDSAPSESDQQDSLEHGKLIPLTVAGQTELLWFGSPSARYLLQRSKEVAALAEKSASQMKSRFIADISHEVRTPINAIIGYTEMLANGQLDSKERRFVTIIHKSSMALVSIFNDIIELSRINSGKFQVMTNTVSLNVVINEIEELYMGVAEEKGIRFSCLIADYLLQPFILDKLRLKQILQNIISNAIKYTHHGSVTLQIDGTPSAADQRCFDLRFIVEDTGVGINEAVDQQRILTLFKEGKEAISKHYGEVGLGLTLCSWLVKRMGGRIEFYSKEGVGTRFTVHFDGVQCAQQTSGEWESTLHAKSSEQEGKLLVIDDVDLIKDVFIDFFADSPYKVLTASNGEEALALAVAERPDIIFMDLNLAGTDGRIVAEQLRQTAETRSIPVVVMTGQMLEEEEYRPLFDDFIQKPFRLEAVKEIILHHARSLPQQGTQPAGFDTDDQERRLFDSQIAAAWNPQLEVLHQQVTSSGSLNDAVLLGTAMQQQGEEENQPELTTFGKELLVYAQEPNILGVDRLLAQLSQIAHSREP